MIKLKSVSKNISGKDVLVDIDLLIEEGKCVLLRGHNGCGKTMLLRLICGLIKPTQGEVFNEKDYRYGVIIETPSFFLNETAIYNLKFLASINKLITEDTINEYLKKLNLYDFKNKRVKTYSLGMKQRLALCQAFMEEPDVIILDEPFNALDDENLKIIYELIDEFKQKGKIIIIASHGEVQRSDLFDEIIQMNAGKIVI